jgi:hypothetical protein
VYEGENVKIFIGDQSDRAFWRAFRERVPALDIVIDDGGHLAEQQIVSLEELLSFLRPGGVYIYEDIHRAHNAFMLYIGRLSNRLNTMSVIEFPNDNERHIASRCTPFQSAVASIHLYPFCAVIERNAVPVNELIAPKHGTQWQPFLN